MLPDRVTSVIFVNRKGQIPLRYLACALACELIRELVCDLIIATFHYAIQVADLVSDLSQTASSYLDMSRWLQPDRRPVQAIFHYVVLLASRSATSSRAGRKLDSVMEFGLNSVTICTEMSLARAISSAVVLIVTGL